MIKKLWQFVTLSLFSCIFDACVCMLRCSQKHKKVYFWESCEMDEVFQKDSVSLLTASWSNK